MHLVSLRGFKIFIYKKNKNDGTFFIWSGWDDVASSRKLRRESCGQASHCRLWWAPSYDRGPPPFHVSPLPAIVAHTLWKPGRHVRFVILTHRYHVSRSTVHVIPPKNRRTICFTVFTPRPCLNITRKRVYILVSWTKRQF